LSPLPAAGSHGAERRSRDGALHAGGEGGQSALESAHQALDRLARREGLLLERKPGAVSLHFRGRDDLERDCYALATRLAGETPALRALKGHKVAEIALAGFDKGRALRAFMTEAPFAGRRPVAAGDDVTDEDAIRAAQALGGVGVRIGTADSAARLRFDDIRGFHRWLDELSRGQATLTRRNG
jgi:trehalose 6-phosphate phosphatase